jgi:hypothetical protein
MDRDATPKRTRAARYCAALVLMVLARDGLAATPATAIGHDLKPVQINIQSLRNGTLSYFGADRAYRTEPLKRFLRLRLLHEPDQGVATERAADDSGIIELADGQRFRGTFQGRSTRPGDDEQILHWRHPQLGDIYVSLEQLSVLGPYHQERKARVAQPVDTATLNNGDIMRGFVRAVTDDGFSLKVHADGQEASIAVERLRSLHLANPSTSISSTADTLHLADGSRLSVESLRLDGDRVTFTAGAWGQGREMVLPLSSLARIDVAAAGATLADLGTLTMTSIEAGDVFALAWPHQVDGMSVRLHAPVTVSFELPPGAKHLATVAALDIGPDEPLEWADFTIVIEVDGTRVGRYHLSAAAPRVPISLPLTGASLVIRLEAGTNGPVMDRLRLIEPLVLIDQ